MIWCLHGALGSHLDWQKLAAERILKDRVRALDLWQPFPDLEFEDWAADWCKTVVTQDQAPILLGYSMGGRLALHAALASPVWRAAIIVSAHTGLTSSAERQQRLVSDQKWLASLKQQSWPDFLAAWDQQSLFDKTPSPFRALHRPTMTRCFQEWSLCNQRDLTPRLTEIRCPVLWVVGEQDSKFRKIGERAVARLPHAQLKVAPDCGHRVPWDWPQFSTEIAQFLVNK